MRLFGAVLGLALAAGCPETRVELTTEVLPDGAVQRTVVVRTTDHGEPAELPDDLVEPASGYVLLRRGRGLLEASGRFPLGAPLPPAFGFRDPRLPGPAGSRAAVHMEDWVLLTRYRFTERVRDAVDPDGIRDALEETGDVLVRLLRLAFQDLLGEDFDQTVLRARLDGDLRRLLREAAFLVWQETALPGRDEDLKEALPRRFQPLLRRYGLDLEREDLADVLEDPDSEGGRRVRRAVADWLQAGLVPRREGARVPVVPDLEPLLFGGAFQEAFSKAVVRHFGSEDAAATWQEGMETRIFGLFGRRNRELRFGLRVHMPGSLLRSTGWLEEGGWTFLSFDSREAYPNGAGLECESLAWRGDALAALPGLSLVTDNTTALSWMRVLGDGPGSRPDPRLVSLLQRCVQARGFGPLEDALEEASSDQGQAGWQARLQAIQAWLRGKGR